MATSSIFENFVIHGENEAVRFVDALEKSATDSVRVATSQVSEPVSDAEKIRVLFGMASSK